MFILRSSLRPRNPVARLIGWILGLLAVVGVIALGFFAFVAILVIGAIWMLVNTLRGKHKGPARSAPTTPENGIIDGEFIVVRESERRTRVEPPASSSTHANRGP
ncbi:hypothetical protein [Dokdonella sp.]|uniref:hypothetical protein n=1 Tax=Dokdonella sp. TaxID=2291710 RepID=UPI003C592A4E